MLKLGGAPAATLAVPGLSALRPRTVETLSQASFVKTKERSLEIFQREVHRCATTI
jgi:NitT/TauT family transport system ATP-binding protein